MKNKLHNFTRRSQSISDRLIKERKFHNLLLYWVLRMSFLASEAMENSGSYQFADHIYTSKPKGLNPLGKFIDQTLLQLPASKAFRQRYFFVKNTIPQHVNRFYQPESTIQLLSVPSGLPRDILESVRSLPNHKVKAFLLDLDPAVLATANHYIDSHQLPHQFEYLHGDALQIEHFPNNVDIITSTGLGEFLTDELLLTFYRNVYQSLKPGGIFLTSATEYNPFSDYLLTEIAEVFTYYRSREKITKLLKQAGFQHLHTSQDKYRLQTLVKGYKL